MLGQVGRKATCGLIAIIAAVSLAVAAASSAGAAINPHAPRSQRGAGMRDARHERPLRGVRESRPAPRSRARRSAGKPGRAAGPWKITIPAIDLTTGLMTLSDAGATVGPDGLSLPVPPLARAADDAGWYQFTAMPGAAGNAVIVGHVDTYAGPAVFYNLYLLRPGDRVYVDANGARQRFDVTSVRELPKPSFPVNQVFGGTISHRLWLITCGGAFDYETRHYLSNIVVSASWIPAAKNHRAVKAHVKHVEHHGESVR